jgi:hypothetical protein
MGAACPLPLQEATTAARSRGLAAPRSNRGGAGAGRRQHKTLVRVMARQRRGSGDAGVRDGLGWHKGAAVAKKGLGRPLRAGHPCNGFRASRVFIAAHPNPSSG